MENLLEGLSDEVNQALAKAFSHFYMPRIIERELRGVTGNWNDLPSSLKQIKDTFCYNIDSIITTSTLPQNILHGIVMRKYTERFFAFKDDDLELVKQSPDRRSAEALFRKFIDAAKVSFDNWSESKEGLNTMLGEWAESMLKVLMYRQQHMPREKLSIRAWCLCGPPSRYLFEIF